jgi:glycosyltransferase involved in cell wall biosynthesis
VAVRVWDLSSASGSDVLHGVLAARPGLVHAFHAFQAGPLAREAARRLAVPYVVTLTGTDVNHDLVAPARASTVAAVLEGAAAITVFHASIAARLARACGAVAGRVAEIAQAVRFERTDPLDPAVLGPLAADGPLVLFPGGVRAVKRPRLALQGLTPLIARHPRLRLVYAGPVLEPPEGAALQAALGARPWARYVGTVPHEQMPALMTRADVVLNTSESEGGMANAVLEALALGRAVLAADIEGNRSLVEPEDTGLLFGTVEELAAQAERLVSDPALRARLGAAGRARVERDYPAAREIDRYLALYRSLDSQSR